MGTLHKLWNDCHNWLDIAELPFPVSYSGTYRPWNCSDRTLVKGRRPVAGLLITYAMQVMLQIRVKDIVAHELHKRLKWQHNRVCSHSENLPRPKSQPNVIRYWHLDSDQDVYRIALKMWIHYLVGINHFAKCRENHRVTVREMLINLLKSRILQSPGMW